MCVFRKNDRISARARSFVAKKHLVCFELKYNYYCWHTHTHAHRHMQQPPHIGTQNNTMNLSSFFSYIKCSVKYFITRKISRLFRRERLLPQTIIQRNNNKLCRDPCSKRVPSVLMVETGGSCGRQNVMQSNQNIYSMCRRECASPPQPYYVCILFTMIIIIYLFII